MTYRGFSYLHSRILLNCQDELATLEKKLDSLDKIDEEQENDGANTGLHSRAKDIRLAKNQQCESRQAVLAEIKHKLLEYGM